MGYYITDNNINSDKGIAVDDMILTKNIAATAGSKMLENFIPLFDAEVITRLKNAGYEISGKTNCGEFGLDLLGETSYFGRVADENGNPAGAAAELVRKGKVKYALSQDVNGAPRRAAAVSGVTYIKPTYGTVSRYGLIPCVCSGETVGVTAENAAAAAEILTVISGTDKKDCTTLPNEKFSYTAVTDIKGKKIAIVKEYIEKADESTKNKIYAVSEQLKKAGADVSEISFGLAEQAHVAWHMALCAETCNNLSRYDGVKFGYRTEEYSTIEELYTKSRTEAFGLLTKSVILYGSDVLSKGRYEKCYDKALRTRRMVREALDGIFKNYDMLLLPVCSKTSYTKEEIKDSIDAVYNEELFTSLASFTGLPACVCSGVQILADTLNDNILLNAAAYLEEAEGTK